MNAESWRVHRSHIYDRSEPINDVGAVDIVSQGEYSELRSAYDAAIRERDEAAALLRDFLSCVEAEWGADFLPYNLSEEADIMANNVVTQSRALLSRVGESSPQSYIKPCIYTLAEIKDGTGFASDAHFVMATPQVLSRLDADGKGRA